MTVTVHPVPSPDEVVAVAVYVPSVYPVPTPVTDTASISPKDLTPRVLLLAITLSLTRKRPASRLPENVASPVAVSILNTSVPPAASKILKS